MDRAAKGLGKKTDGYSLKITKRLATESESEKEAAEPAGRGVSSRTQELTHCPDQSGREPLPLGISPCPGPQLFHMSSTGRHYEIV